MLLDPLALILAQVAGIWMDILPKPWFESANIGG
jgi:hypothetical protein